MADFNLYYPKLKRVEGGYASAEYAKSKQDKGGETYGGLARNYTQDWSGWALIDQWKAKNGQPKYNSVIPSAEINNSIKPYYKKFFWDKDFGDIIKSQSIAELIVDWRVNGRDISASKGFTQTRDLQKKVGAKVDGVIGRDTIDKINEYKDQGELFNYIKKLRQEYYETIGKNNPNYQGWLNRLKGFTYDGLEFAKENKGTVGVILFFLVAIVFSLIYLKNGKK